MDVGWLQRLLIGAATLITAGSSGEFPLQTVHWVQPGARLAVLSSEPTECLGSVDDPDLARSVSIGRTAFRTPLLLGGQAARVGLSCASCHRNGRGNPDFLFPGVSKAAGTADVTTSILSAHRGDGTFNPRPIPDLSGPKGELRIDQTPATRQLEQFIQGLVVEEFEGPKPSARVLTGLADYVRQLAPAHCPVAASQPVVAAHAIDDVMTATQAARQALIEGDAETARLMLAAARTTLGVIAQRYQALPRAREMLRAAAITLGEIAGESGNAPAALTALEQWRLAADGWRSQVLRDEKFSLYNPERLRQTLVKARLTAP